MSHENDLHAYRIGYWTHRWWPLRAQLVGLITGNQQSPRADNGSRYVGRRVWVKPILRNLKRIRRPHRPWQAEYEDCRWCRRAWTKAGALRKAESDRRHMLATGEWSPWIQRKVRWRYGPDAAMGPTRIESAS